MRLFSTREKIRAGCVNMRCKCLYHVELCPPRSFTVLRPPSSIGFIARDPHIQPLYLSDSRLFSCMDNGTDVLEMGTEIVQMGAKTD